eukprot:ctg_341.g106
MLRPCRPADGGRTGSRPPAGVEQQVGAARGAHSSAAGVMCRGNPVAVAGDAKAVASAVLHPVVRGPAGRHRGGHPAAGATAGGVGRSVPLLSGYAGVSGARVAEYRSPPPRQILCPADRRSSGGGRLGRLPRVRRRLASLPMHSADRGGGGVPAAVCRQPEFCSGLALSGGYVYGADRAAVRGRDEPGRRGALTHAQASHGAGCTTSLESVGGALVDPSARARRGSVVADACAGDRARALPARVRHRGARLWPAPVVRDGAAPARGGGVAERGLCSAPQAETKGLNAEPGFTTRGIICPSDRRRPVVVGAHHRAGPRHSRVWTFRSPVASPRPFPRYPQ